MAARTKTKSTEQLSLMEEPKQAPKAQLPARMNAAAPAPAKGRGRRRSNPTPDNLLGAIIVASKDPEVKPPQLRELLDIKREIEKDYWKAEFNKDFLAARKKMPPIAKDGTGDKKIKYPTLENVSTQVDKIALEHGFTHSWGQAESNKPDHYRIVCTLRHSAGHEATYFNDYPADNAGPKGNRNKSDVQAVGSTTSYARRVMKIGIWDLVIVGSDKDGGHQPDMNQDAPEPLSEKQNEELMAKIAHCGVPINKVLVKYHVKKVAEIPAASFDHAMAACDNYAKEKEASDSRKKK